MPNRLASAGVSMVEQDAKNGCCQLLSPQGAAQLSSAFMGGSPKSVSGSDASTFQTTSLYWDSEREILNMLFKSVVSVSYSPVALLNVSPTVFQSSTFRRLVFLLLDHWAEKLNVCLEPLIH